MCVNYEVRILTGDFNQTGQYIPGYLAEVQMSMAMMHRDSGACNTTGREFTYDLQYASDQSQDILIVVFNYPGTAHPKWKFKQHDIVELMRAEDIGLIKPEHGDTHNPIWGIISIDDGTPAVQTSNKERESQRSQAAQKKRSTRLTSNQLKELLKSRKKTDVEYAEKELARRLKAKADLDEAAARKTAVKHLAK